jgi:predicted nucleic acid-binding protein
MRTVYVDASVFMRFFVRDDEAQRKQAARLFRQAASGERALVAGPPVLFEIAWTLRSAYGLSRERVLGVLASLRGLQGLELTDRDVVDEALRLARESGQEFADAYIAASATLEGADAVATFNRRHFEKLAVPLHAF